MLQAQQQRLDAENSLAQAQADVGRRYAALYKALGGGSSVDGHLAKSKALKKGHA